MNIEIVKKMSRENHKLRSVYFVGTAADIVQMKEHGYTIVRRIRNRVYEARVTDQGQFIAYLDSLGIGSTMSEDVQND